MKNLKFTAVIAAAALLLCACGSNTATVSETESENTETPNVVSVNEPTEYETEIVTEEEIVESGDDMSEDVSDSDYEEDSSLSGWPDASTYELLEFMDGSQRYLSIVDVEEGQIDYNDPNFYETWTQRLNDLNASSYNITNFYSSCGKGGDLIVGTDNPDDIVKTQQLLEEMANTYGLTITGRWNNG